MEIQPAENRTLDALIANWSTHPEDELEATFGEKGTVDSTTFLGIAKRLAAKGYQARPQEDKLNVILPNKIRITLSSLGIIQQYCKDDKLTGKPFTAMTKDATRAEANLFLNEYDVKIKSRREKTLAQDDFNLKKAMDAWPAQKKAFRLIKRWSFSGHGMQIDMSIVRMTPRDARGEFQWVRGFTEQDVFRQPPIYEIEVELKRGEETDTPEKAKKCLVRGIGEILRAIQKNTILIRKSVRSEVLRQYQKIVRSDRFRGAPPVTLERKNIAAVDENSVEIQDNVPNIRFGYNVTDKADGLRVMPFVDNEGNLFMIDMGFNVYRTGLRNGACRGSLLDGEWVTQTKDGRPVNLLLLFDIYYATDGSSGSRDVSVLPFADLDNSDTETRYNTLLNWVKTWKENEAATTKSLTDTNRLIVGLKTFRFSRGIVPPSGSDVASAAGDAATTAPPPVPAASRYDYNSIFEACSQTLSMPVIYHTDGLILTPNSAPLPSRPGETFFQQFKWKPASLNTVDFLVTLEKDPEISSLDLLTTGIHPRTGETVRYKTLRLFVGSSKDPAFEDPRSTILNELPIPDPPNRRGPGAAPIRYKPILFSPMDYPDTMASVCNRVIELDATTGEEFVTTEDGEAIHDRTIVEMRYDPAQPQGWRWIPMRIRHDKTERLMRGTLERTLNSEKVAESVWNSIHEPVTEYMIRSGSEEPSDEEIRAMSEARGETRADISLKYYDRKASSEDLMAVRGLRDFHNRYIKEEIIYKSILKRRGARLVDYTCGKAADLQKWRRGRVGFVLGLDIAGESIRNKTDGAYRRYLDSMVNAGGRDRIAPMVFAIADSTKDIVSGAGGATQEESDILRSIFGRAETEGALPKYVSKELAGKLRRGADAGVLMFSLHYFFQSKEALDGLVNNLASTIKEGGYFAGCCFDGEAVFNFLSRVGKDGSRLGREGNDILWSIVKKYDAPELPDDETSLGMPIEVEFITIGTPHTEYLVNFKYLTKRLADIGMQLLTEGELAELGLKNSTNMFGETYTMAEERGRKYPMTDDIKTFSFLNRWFIFKKRGADVAAAAVAANATATVAKAVEAAATAVVAPDRAAEVLAETEPATTIASSILAREGAAEGDATIQQASMSVTGDEGMIVPAGAAAASAAVPKTGPYIALDPSAKYPISRVFLFYLGADKKTAYGDPVAARWLAPGSLFPIQDPDRTDVEYPSTEHFLAAMFYRYATDKPDLAISLFSSTGTIHQTFLAETMGKSDDVRHEKLTEVIAKIRSTWYNSTTRKRAFNSYKVKAFNEAAWMTEKDRVIEYSMRWRWEKDARFRKIVDAAREDGKYLLFYVLTGIDELGGRRDREGHIIGENKIGRAIMKLAGY